ncbi:alpha-(1,3)-fucosyltransferase C isoform X2 [Lepeophtheirus salmonis]|uniref:alpha-(1,3)-fucosyltransferase C isoform X2 n=1 Tax=Lepeophtheirus salmonis TaxID=72036 RepID=UPI001AE70D95|nr:alpha-(1,3)-fucosyltransferase C-like isoform X2 [Lepeophtheirus salmonis]
MVLYPPLLPYDSKNLRRNRILFRHGWKIFIKNLPMLFIVMLFILFYFGYNLDSKQSRSSFDAAVFEYSTYQYKEDLLMYRGSKAPWLLRKPDGNTTRLKTILYWNEFYGRYDTYDFGYGHDPFVENNCKVSDCYATKDRALMSLDEFDALIIHIRGLPNDWPKSRDWDKQSYVMLAIEAPIYLSEYRQLENLQFNWTMTYRLDSDFPIPYAWMDRIKPLPSEIEAYIKSFGKRKAKNSPSNDKVGLLAQLNYPSSSSTDCEDLSRTDGFMKDLPQHISIDVYGDCGDLSCTPKSVRDCYSELEKKYKFIITVETADCKDYITEGFFTALGLNLIPIVHGGGLTNYSNFAPYKSFIDASKFESPAALANYLKLLDSDDARYYEYFWWKDFYKKGFHHHQALCDLCAKLHDKERESFYPDMQKWWINDAKCTPANKDY